MAGASLALLLLTGGRACGGDAEAERYLRLSMGRSFGRAVVAMIEQRDPFSLDGGGERVRAKVERDARGRVRSSIARPLRLQGVTILDDGERMTIRLPDERLVIEQDSPAREDGPAEARLALVRGNYVLRVGPGPETLGRATVTLEARARRRGIDTRRYLLDAATGFPLRSEIVNEGGTETIFEAVMVRFVARLPERTFERGPTDGFQVVRYESPARPRPGEAVRRMGFEPAVPKDPPFGFRVTGVAMLQTPRWRAVAVRLTDGLVKASVYEWIAGPEDSALADAKGRSVGRRRGKTVLVVAETSALVRARLLDAVLDAMP